jgi:hypothetical protein
MIISEKEKRKEKRKEKTTINEASVKYLTVTYQLITNENYKIHLCK